MSARYDLEMVRGDTMECGLEINGSSTSPSAISFACRKNLNDSSYTFQKTLNNGISYVSGSGTVKNYEITVAPADTSGDTPGNYWYDIQITIDSKVYTPLYGILKILPDVTHT